MNVLERVRTLLFRAAHSFGENDHEAMNAAVQAARLIHKHGLVVSLPEADERPEQVCAVPPQHRVQVQHDDDDVGKVVTHAVSRAGERIVGSVLRSAIRSAIRRQR